MDGRPCVRCNKQKLGYHSWCSECHAIVVAEQRAKCGGEPEPVNYKLPRYIPAIQPNKGRRIVRKSEPMGG
jgi:hypothetical protein